MSNHRFTLSVRGSKAVESADIVIDDITVLAGVNAAGKSTLARMMNLLVNLSQNYPLLAQKAAWKNLTDLAFQIRQFDCRIKEATSAFILAAEAGPDFTSMVGTVDFSLVLKLLHDYSFSVLEKYFSSAQNGDRQRAYATFLRGIGVGEEFAQDVDKVKNVIQGKLDRAMDRYHELCAVRRYDVYNNALGDEVNWLVDADSVCLSEGGQIVYETERSEDHQAKSAGKSPLKEIFGLRKSFYLASPWYSVPTVDENGILRIPGDEFAHAPSRLDVPVDQDLFGLMNGSFDKKEVPAKNRAGVSDWVYRRKDGLEVEFKDCATGLKSLAILNLLYKNRYLDSETLLIIDEPEVHLHPQWVVQYAKILVQICKTLKVRLLLTSHSPDMVSALKVMSEAEGVTGVNFYSAESSQTDKYRYAYRSQGNDIEKIFECFGRSIEAIDNYQAYLKS